IFNNTYPELLSLHQQIEEFQIAYQSNIKVIIPYNPIVENFHNQEELDKSILLDESNLNKSILNNEQINKFKKIYHENKIENIDDNNEDSILNIKTNWKKKMKKLNIKNYKQQYIIKKYIFKI
ncbi:15661_t:CDS:1, partial [Dentiscutata heterogama]